MRLQEFATIGFSTSNLRYPYRVKTKNGQVALVKDPSKGLGKLSEAVKGSRGEANEIFTAAALYIAFKNKKLDETLLKKFILTNIASLSPSIDIKSKPNNRGDSFQLRLPIPTSLQETLFDPANYEAGGLYDGLLNKVVQYVKTEFTEQVNFIHDNNRKDSIDIAVVGGAGKKVDVSGYVTYTDAAGKPKKESLKNMQISMKIDTDRFDQLSGKKMVASFQRALGIDTAAIAKQSGLTQALEKANPLMLQITKTQVGKNISRQDADKVLAKIENLLYGNGDGPMYKFYNTIASTLNKQLAGKQGENKERKIIADALGNVIKQGIGDVTMVNFEKDGYTILDQSAIQKLSDLMKTTDLRVDYNIRSKKKDDAARPYLEFYDTKDNEMFFFIRNAMDHYATIRNFVQSGKKFNQFKRTVKYQ